MTKLDLKKELNHLYTPSPTAVAVVDVPPMKFLAVDGHGDPNVAPAYKEAVEALFSLSYAIKFIIKKGPLQIDYGVMPLEGLWWVEDMRTFSIERKSDWQWTAMIAQPEFVTEDLTAQAAVQTAGKKKLPALPLVRFTSFHEGRAAQIMHIGPYAAEGPTIARLHTFIEEQGYSRHGKHHEIYLSDPSRSSPDTMKTVIRQPFI